jgi:ketosteroid isomerase-like protein
MLAALLAKDSSKVNSYYAADAVIATPGRPAAKDGRAVPKAIRDDTEDPNFKMSLSNEKTEVAGSGDLGYRRGTFKSLIRTRRAGTYLTVFKKQADGSWKVVADFGV